MAHPLNEERDEWLPPNGDLSRLEKERRQQGWREAFRELDQSSGWWRYRWQYAPDEIEAEDRRHTIVGALVLLVAVMLIVAGISYAVSHRDSGSSTSTPTSEPYTPINSEGEPAVGPFPAPPDDPCWRQTEEAVEISPSDGGQSAMPQRCIDKGF